MTARPSLQRRLTLGVLGYLVLLSAVVFGHGYVVNEAAEALMWQSLLNLEMDELEQRLATEPDWRPDDTESPTLLTSDDPAPMPALLRSLPPGLHDEIVVDGRESVVLIREHGRDHGRQRRALVLDITELERTERDIGLKLALSTLAVVALLGLAIAWGVGRLVRPLRELAARIRRLQPDAPAQRVDLPLEASAELVVIADALNAYLQRHDRFVERERAFIDTASHELRTPVAVIAGATELALAADVPAPARLQLQRIGRTARGVEQLISLLLVLAKDPQRLADSSDRFALDQLLPEIADDHRHLCREKDLRLRVLALPACEVVAPLGIVQAAIGNLLRNAIENSDSGEVVIGLEPGAMVVIEDPGHGMSPEQVSAIYARRARGDGRGGGGIGLDLITRLCAHLGWHLRIDSGPGQGTRATLDLGSVQAPLARR